MPTFAKSSVALLAAAAFGFGNLAASLHYVVVSHTVCADHGELVHGDGHGDAGHSDDHEAWTVSDAGSDEHGHDHCGTTVLAPEAAELKHTILADTGHGYSGVSDWVSHLTVATRYHLAPKTSPPA